MSSQPNKQGRGGGLGGLLRGGTYAARGILYLMRNRRTWVYAVAPALVHVVTLLALGTAAFFVVDDVYRWVQPDWLVQPEAEAGWLTGLLRALLRGLVAVAAFLMVAGGAILGTLLVAAVLAGPFNEKLSEVVELLATGRSPPDEPLRLSGLTRDSARAMAAALQRLVMFSLFYVPLLLFSLVPVVGIVGAVGTFIYSCFFLALNFLDPALDRRKLSFREKLRWARSVWGVCMGFGVVLFGLMLLPVVNLVLAPCFVAGGTLLWVDFRPAQAGLAGHDLAGRPNGDHPLPKKPLGGAS